MRAKQPTLEFTEPDVYDTKQLWKAVIDLQKTSKPLLRHPFVSIETDVPIALCFTSDWHIGSRSTNHERLLDDVEFICDHPRLFALVGGDPTDNFIARKYAHAARGHIVPPETQWKLFRDLIEDLLGAKSLIAVGEGNHDLWTKEQADVNGVRSALAGLPVEYIGESGYLTVEVGDEPYRIWRKHRPSRFKSSLHQTNFLRQMLAQGLPQEFDIGVSEHYHTAEFATFEYRPGSGIARYVFATGSYKTDDEYAREAGFYGGGYGVPCAILYPNRRQIIPCRSIYEAADILDGVWSEDANESDPVGTPTLYAGD